MQKRNLIKITTIDQSDLLIHGCGSFTYITLISSGKPQAVCQLFTAEMKLAFQCSNYFLLLTCMSHVWLLCITSYLLVLLYMCFCVSWFWIHSIISILEHCCFVFLVGVECELRMNCYKQMVILTNFNSRCSSFSQ